MKENKPKNPASGCPTITQVACFPHGGPTYSTLMVTLPVQTQNTFPFFSGFILPTSCHFDKEVSSASPVRLHQGRPRLDPSLSFEHPQCPLPGALAILFFRSSPLLDSWLLEAELDSAPCPLHPSPPGLAHGRGRGSAGRQDSQYGESLQSGAITGRLRNGTKVFSAFLVGNLRKKEEPKPLRFSG